MEKENKLKIKLLSFAFITTLSFFYLVLPANAGLSVPIFVLLQFIGLFYTLPSKKPLWLFVPIFILSLNSYISGNEIWRESNFIIIIILYSIM
ncbi:MAG: hypothetical protein H7Y41_04790, partial [Hyphomonadaceae bacterium]|nr:hypothetical protein [Clostridia bacterium]